MEKERGTRQKGDCRWLIDASLSDKICAHGAGIAPDLNFLPARLPTKGVPERARRYVVSSLRPPAATVHHCMLSLHATVDLREADAFFPLDLDCSMATVHQ